MIEKSFTSFNRSKIIVDNKFAYKFDDASPYHQAQHKNMAAKKKTAKKAVKKAVKKVAKKKVAKKTAKKRA
jgi:hypothetical protein